MKLDARRLAGFLKDPGPCRAVLLYGDDEGLIRERSRALTITVAGSTDDPFRVVELNREGWPHIAGESAAISMMGGRRVVRVREVTDAALGAVTEALKGRGDALIILEAPGLGKGKLRSFIEAATDAATITCYPEEGPALQELIRAMFTEAGVKADGEAISWLAETTGGDRAVVRNEVAKLALLAGAGGRVDLELAREVAGDSAGASGDEALLAATTGKTILADSHVERAMAEGLAAIALIRMALGHLQKLHQVRLLMAGGESAGDALRALRPPVFFKSIPAMTASVSLWSADALLRAIEEARQVEIACKQTGSRPELLVRRFVAGLARQAQARTRAG